MVRSEVLRAVIKTMDVFWNVKPRKPQSSPYHYSCPIQRAELCWKEQK